MYVTVTKTQAYGWQMGENIMKQRRFQNLITKIKVQKQLYIIYFIAMFIPFASIGGYLVFNTRSLNLNITKSRPILITCASNHFF